MKIIRAEPLGMCFGVRDAIALALEQADAGAAHHPRRPGSQRRRSWRPCGPRALPSRTQPAQVRTHTVMVTAHGASERALAEHPRARPGGRRSDLPARARGASGRRGARARRLSPGHHRPARPRGGAGADGRPRRLRRRAGRERCAGARASIRASASPRRRRSRSSRVRHLVALIRRRFPNPTSASSIRSASRRKQRQDAAVELARQCDVVIVVGGANSNNTRELVNTCRQHCSRVHHVQTDVGSSSGMVPRRAAPWASRPARRRPTMSSIASTGASGSSPPSERVLCGTSQRGRGAGAMNASCTSARTLVGSSWCLPLAWHGSKRPASTTFA